MAETAGGFEVRDDRGRRHGMVWVDDWATPRMRMLSHAERNLYVTLLCFAGRYTGECWPKQANLAQIVGVDPRTVRRGIAHLKELGYIEVARVPRGRKRINVYRLLSPPSGRPE